MKNFLFLLILVGFMPEVAFSGDVETEPIFQKPLSQIEVCNILCSSALITGATPEGVKKDWDFKIQWRDVWTKSSVVLDLADLIKSKRPVKKVDFDCRWTVKVIDGSGIETNLFLPGGGEDAIIDGVPCSVDANKAQKFLSHFAFIKDLLQK